jgi:hypothetical protein
VAEIRALQAAVDLEAERVTAIAIRGFGEIDENTTEPPAGWSKRSFRIAKHALKPTPEAPIALKLAASRCESARRQTDDRGTTINVLIVKLPEGDTREPEKVVVIDA